MYISVVVDPKSQIHLVQNMKFGIYTSVCEKTFSPFVVKLIQIGPPYKSEYPQGDMCGGCFPPKKTA